MKMKPQKRDKIFQPLSREHHHGLLLCWKIRTGLKKKIEPDRIKIYTDWFWKTHLERHFEIEEKFIFPILSTEHQLIKRALTEHHNLKYLFGLANDIPGNLAMIEKELESHIRFEERILFNEIQMVATEEQLLQIKNNHTESQFSDNLSDPFWE